MRHTERGFAALIAVVIISALLELLVAGGGARSYSALADILGTERKIKSYYSARSCAALALLEISRNPDFSKDAPYTLGDTSCKITNVEKQASVFVITTESVVEESRTQLTTKADRNDLHIISQQEN
jgi:hypothetical protein